MDKGPICTFSLIAENRCSPAIDHFLAAFLGACITGPMITRYDRWFDEEYGEWLLAQQEAL